jgi:tRNA G18 (ribose-2'-O)-methylase SpoU
MRRTVLVIHNVRSALNVGSMLRTAEGLGVDKVYITGYTPYPETENDERLPHHRRRTSSQIHKTALGAEQFMKWDYEAELEDCLKLLRKDGFILVALEQTPDALNLADFKSDKDVALVVGNEVEGLDSQLLESVDLSLKIPMSGRKESFNVAVAAGIALYHLSYVARTRQKKR